MGVAGILFNLLTGYFTIYAIKDLTAIITSILSGITFLAVILLGIILAGRPASEIFPVKKMDMVFLIYIAITCTGLVIVLSEVDNIFQKNVPVPDFFSDMLIDLLTGNGILSTAVLIGIIAPLTEESLFRGVIYSGLKKNYPARTAIIVSALLFSIFHVNPLQMTGAFVGGLFLAWILERTNNILYPIAAHSIFNLFPFLILRLTSLEIPGFTEIDPVSKNYQPLWFDLMGIFILISGIILVNRHMDANFKKSGDNDQRDSNKRILQNG